jgi:hypothetical protein
MELSISVMLVAKIMGFMVISLILAAMSLAPINDQSISKTQFIVWLILEVILFVILFGFVTFKVVA